MELFPILFWNKLYIIAKLRKSKVKPNSGSYGCLKSIEKNGYCFWIKKNATYEFEINSKSFQFWIRPLPN